MHDKLPRGQFVRLDERFKACAVMCLFVATSVDYSGLCAEDEMYPEVVTTATVDTLPLPSWRNFGEIINFEVTAACLRLCSGSC